RWSPSTSACRADMAFEAMKENLAKAWGTGNFELLAATLRPIHEDLIERLAVRPADRWLAVPPATGALPTPPPRPGADVSALAFSPGLIDPARRLAGERGLKIDFSVGDCEALPYDNESFDAVSSAQGAIFGPEHRAVARELTRVCATGGRVGLTAWR